MPQLFPLVGISLKTLKILLTWAQLSHFLVISQMRSKDALILLHQRLAIWVNVCLVTKISRFTQRLQSMMQSSSPPSLWLRDMGPMPMSNKATGVVSHQTSPVNSWLRCWHKVTHSVIISMAGIPTIESMLLLRQLRRLGHVIRTPHSRLPHCVLYCQLSLGHRTFGG